MALLSCVYILFVVSPYPVDLVGHHSGWNKAMQQDLVVEPPVYHTRIYQLYLNTLYKDGAKYTLAQYKKIWLFHFHDFGSRHLVLYEIDMDVTVSNL